MNTVNKERVSVLLLKKIRSRVRIFRIALLTLLIAGVFHVYCIEYFNGTLEYSFNFASILSHEQVEPYIVETGLIDRLSKKYGRNLDVFFKIDQTLSHSINKIRYFIEFSDKNKKMVKDVLKDISDALNASEKQSCSALFVKEQKDLKARISELERNLTALKTNMVKLEEIFASDEDKKEKLYALYSDQIEKLVNGEISNGTVDKLLNYLSIYSAYASMLRGKSSKFMNQYVKDVADYNQLLKKKEDAEDKLKSLNLAVIYGIRLEKENMSPFLVYFFFLSLILFVHVSWIFMTENNT